MVYPVGGWEVDLVLNPVSPWLKIYSQPGKYPKIWNKGIIQRHLIDLAQGCCECCGQIGTNSDLPEATNGTVLLHVHHLKWQAKHDARWENLLVCCTGCHTRLHNQKWQPGKPWNPKHGPIPNWAFQRGLLDETGHPNENPPTVDAAARGEADTARVAG
jgi:hypothetical protein